MSDDIVERLRSASGQMYVNELRSDAADAGVYRSWKIIATEGADEIERLRRLLKAFEEARRIAQYLRENAKTTELTPTALGETGR